MFLLEVGRVSNAVVGTGQTIRFLFKRGAAHDCPEYMLDMPYTWHW